MFSDKKISNKLWCLILALFLSSLLHYARLPIFLVLINLGAFLLAMIYPVVRPYLHRSVLKPILNPIRVGLLLGGLSSIWNHYGTFFGLDAGTAMLVLLSGFKIFEMRDVRDFYINSFLACFLVATHFLYNQSILTAILMCAILWLTTIALIGHNNHGNKMPFLSQVKLAWTILFQSVPFMVVLFFLFPRIPGPLWGMPENNKVAKTGISEQMSFNSISRLIESDEIAFRVKFANSIPAQSDLYWRGPVLYHTDGKNWSMRAKRRFETNKSQEFLSLPLSYELTMEASGQRWLFPLEMLSQWPSNIHFDADRQLKMYQNIDERTRFKLTSHIDFQFGKQSDSQQLTEALQLPASFHPKARQLATSWRDHSSSDAEVIKKAVSWFKKEGFYYTLTPPILRDEPIDEFLFGTRRGFCEHYAAAFTVLMRAAKIPARIVTGYLGGEFNSVGGYLVVRQHDAHAWTELWLPERGWVRFDPTAIVAPQRIDQGISTVLPNIIGSIPSWLGQNSMIPMLWMSILRNWDALNFHWQQWIISYDAERQLEFFSIFGLPDIDRVNMIIIVFSILALLLCVLGYYILRQYKVKVDPAKYHYEKFCQKLARCGIVRVPSETPKCFAERAAMRRPDLSQAIMQIIDSYIAIRYQISHVSIYDLKHKVQNFQIR